MDPTQPNPLLVLILSTVMGVVDILTLFHVGPVLTDAQRTAVIYTTTSLFGLGVIVYAFFRQQGWIHGLVHMREMKKLSMLEDSNSASLKARKGI